MAIAWSCDRRFRRRLDPKAIEPPGAMFAFHIEPTLEHATLASAPRSSVDCQRLSRFLPKVRSNTMDRIPATKPMPNGAASPALPEQCAPAPDEDGHASARAGKSHVVTKSVGATSFMSGSLDQHARNSIAGTLRVRCRWRSPKSCSERACAGRLRARAAGSSRARLERTE